MIDPKELRIGNTVMFDGDAKDIEGWHLGYDQVIADPIPLTPEWLERLGFEYVDGEDIGVYWEKQSRRREFTIVEVAGHDGVFMYEGDDIDHVHQLQNLYFALTGQELTIKEKATGI